MASGIATQVVAVRGQIDALKISARGATDRLSRNPKPCGGRLLLNLLIHPGCFRDVGPVQPLVPLILKVTCTRKHSMPPSSRLPIIH